MQLEGAFKPLPFPNLTTQLKVLSLMVSTPNHKTLAPALRPVVFGKLVRSIIKMPFRPQVLHNSQNFSQHPRQAIIVVCQADKSSLQTLQPSPRNPPLVFPLRLPLAPCLQAHRQASQPQHGQAQRPFLEQQLRPSCQTLSLATLYR